MRQSKAKGKIISLLLAMAMVVSVFAATSVPAFASAGAYTVTFTVTDVSAVVGDDVVTSVSSTADGTLDFKIRPSMDYRVTGVSVTGSSAQLTKNKTNNYTLSEVDAATSVTITATAVPSDYWTASSNYDTDWYTNGSSPYSISTAAELAGLAYLVNNTSETFSGDIINLTGSGVDLSSHKWMPIGGVAAISNGVPNTTHYFAGTFNGNSVPVSGMYIDYVNSANSGYGLFGYVNGGALINIKLDSSGENAVSNEVNVGTNSVSGIGSIAGYCNGDIYNCHSDAWVFMGNTTASMLGGIVGTEENNTTTSVYVQFCSNTGDLVGRGRVGGIVGAAYCTSAGGVVIDNCFNKADLSTVGVATKSYLGGIVGYCRGYITNCYSFSHIETNGGHYQAGIAGLIQGSGPMGGMSNCYAYSTFGSDANANYDRWLVGSVDNSTTMTIADSLWIDTYELGKTSAHITQPTGTSTARWGYWTKTGYFYDSSLSEPYSSVDMAYVYSTSPDSWQSLAAVAGVLNVADGLTDANTASPACRVSGNAAFAQSNNKINNGYPYLKWEAGTAVPAYSPASGGTETGTSPVYLDGTATTNGNGSLATPYNNLASAIDGVINGGTVYVTGPVTISNEVGSYKNINYVRTDSDTSSPMFTVTSTGYASFANATITDIASTATFSVAGELRLLDGTTISGSAIGVDANSDYVTITGADVTGSTYSVKVEAGKYVTLKPTAVTDFTGDFRLESGGYISLGLALQDSITVNSAVTTVDTLIAAGEKTVITSSVSYITVPNHSLYTDSDSSGWYIFIDS